METKSPEWMSAGTRATFERWLQLHEGTWIAEGADPQEVKEDIESHLLLSRQSNDRLVSMADLEMALGEMAMPPLTADLSLADVPPKRKGLTGMITRFWGMVFGHWFFLGVWPLLVICYEALTGQIGELFYDPISRWPQLVLLLGVGVVGLLGQIGRSKGWDDSCSRFSWGLGMATAVYWGIFSIPVIAIGTFWYGMGVFYTIGAGLIAFPIYLLCVLAALTPVLIGVGSWKLGGKGRGKTPWVLGVGVGALLLLLVELPAYVTYYGISKNNPGLVRDWGSESVLRQVAGRGTWGNRPADTAGSVWRFALGDLMGRDDRSNEKVEASRRFYYRVTGKDFRSEKNERFGLSRTTRRGGADSNTGGDIVGARVEELDLSGSRLDGHVDANSGLGYWEWTMEFRNDGRRQKEARMQILLPPEGVVSRLTLWVEGEPQEAAFAAKSKVTRAYKSIVSVRRDPVLVRWVGADRVMVQCFPVPEKGTMKIRLGVTAPLDSRGRLFLPRIIERNFEFRDQLKTKVWIQGDTRMSMDGLEGEGSVGKWRETHGSLPLEELTDRHSHLKCELNESSIVWCRDRFAGEEDRFLIREKMGSLKGEARNLVIVVDGSVYFEEWRESFIKAMALLKNHGHRVRVIYAAEDGVRENDNVRFVGGQDNLPALMHGLKVAGETGADELIWLHGVQPVEFEDSEEFLQIMERGFSKVKFSVMDLGGGPNRLLEQIQSQMPVASAGRPGGPDDLPGELLEAAKPTGSKYFYRTSGEKPSEGKEVWDHLARSRAWGEVMAGVVDGGISRELSERAALYQLVTPASGAVVLESASQYGRFDLNQVEAGTTPSIPGVPEPSSALLVLLSAGLIWRRDRKKSLN